MEDQAHVTEETEESHEKQWHSGRLTFIEELIPQISAEQFQNFYRVTPHGLFISSEVQQELLQYYRTWIEKKLGATVEQSDRKLFRKLFGDDSPRRVLLHEGKRTLSGIILKCPIQQPQKYRVPFYLGSPVAASETLLGSDPLLIQTGLRVSVGKQGQELEIPVKDIHVVVPEELLKRFVALALHSVKVEQRYPKCKESLTEAAIALAGTLQHSRGVKITEEPLRPLAYETRRDLECRTVSGFIFYFDRQRRLTFLYHLYAQNLYNFLRDEVVAIKDRSVVGLKIFPRRHRYLGELTINAKAYHLHPHSFCRFASAMFEHALPWKKEQVPMTVKKLLPIFAETLVLSQPIRTDLVRNHLRKDQQRGHLIRANGRSLFVINERGEVVDYIAR